MNWLLSALLVFTSSLALAVGPLQVGKSGVLRDSVNKTISIRVDVNDASNVIVGWDSFGDDWVSTVVRNSEGVFTVTAKPGWIYRTPHCVASSDANHEPGGTFIDYRYTITSGQLPEININTINAANANVDEDFLLVCRI